MVQQTLWEWTHGGVQGECDESEQVRAMERALRAARVDVSGLDAPSREELTRAHGLHRHLEQRLGEVSLTITKNRRRMVSVKRVGASYELRLHRMFLAADEQVASALGRFARGDEGSQREVEAFIEANREQVEVVRVEEQLGVSGRCHDLEALLKSARVLLGEPEMGPVRIMWGRRGQGKRSIRLGSYDFGQRLIRIHPALDEPWVPRFFVEFIVYHELLHAICPPVPGEHRRSVHTEAFCRRERLYPWYEEALAWESANLSRLLKAT